MNKPILSTHFMSREPSDIRLAQMAYAERKDKPEAVVNVGIGNVSLPSNPAMLKRLFALDSLESPFNKGVIRYSGTVGFPETQNAFKNILESQGFDTSKLHVQITDGGSAGMELLLLGVCGPAGSSESPLLVIDPAYTNYISFAKRIGRKIVTITRHLGDDGKFNLPDMSKIEKIVEEHKPGALLVIPYDNPSGQFYNYKLMEDLARVCVKHNMWFVSDEAYRGLYYDEDEELVSIWGLSEEKVPGIEGRRISLETASKVWNACGLRIGALVTDNKEFHTRCVAENTANLCANVVGQYVFGALAHESKEDILAWIKQQKDYYKEQIIKFHADLTALDPRLIVSSPSSSIYSVIDVRNIVQEGFDSIDFALYCAREGSVNIEGVETALIIAPMKGFYNIEEEAKNPGMTQFRVSFVEPAENMAKVPKLFMENLKRYLDSKN